MSDRVLHDVPNRMPNGVPNDPWRWLPAPLALGGYALSFAAYPRLPIASSMDMSRLLPFSAQALSAQAPLETADRAFVAFGLPTVAVLLWLVLHDAPVSALGRATARLRGWAGTSAAEFEKFAPTYHLIVAWTVALVLSFHVAFLAIALDWTLEPGRVVGVVFGGGLLLVGNVVPRLRPNVVAGIRTARTLRDPQLWVRVHRRYGALWVAGGIAVLILTVAAPRYALVSGVAVLLLSSVAMLVADDASLGSSPR